MNYFIVSFLVGGILTLIPQVNPLLSLITSILYRGTLSSFYMFVLWGSILSAIVFVSKDLIAKRGYIKFWWMAFIIGFVMILFAAFLSNSPTAVFY